MSLSEEFTPSFVVACVLVLRCCECVCCSEFWVKVKAHQLWVRCHGYTVLFILRYILLLYSAGSGVNRLHVVLSGFSVRLFFCPGKHFMKVWLYVFIGCTLACVCRCNCDVICVGHNLNRCSG